ncbi:CdaR family protein [Halalkalibacillus halophilus]|uniref:CdaR family protein n=1 Tax=Halalkalibacillus halophilus TaxID=392827 RepID=UPI0004003ABD|nr:CdaR family protein [Halalkalibacillus halophilus]
MDNLIKSPWFTRIVSLFLALLLYVTVAVDEANTSRSNDTFLPSNSSESEMMENVPLQVILDDEQYVVRGVPDTVNVTVEGQRSVITQTVRQRNFDIQIDLNDLGPGEHEVEVEHSGIPNQLEVYIEPRMIEVIIEERSTVTLPVEIDYVGRNDIDESEVFASAPVVSPQEVEVTGSSEEVESIAMVKAIVSFAELSQDGIATNTPVRVYDSDGNELNVFVNPSTVEIEADVSVSDKRYPIRHETTGELSEDLVLEGISVDPVSATLFGTTERLEEINMLEAISVDLSEIEESTTIEADLPLPSGTTKIEPETVEIEVTVQEAIEEVYEEMEVEVENLEDDQEITFLDPEDPEIDVTVIGTEEDLEDLDRDDIRVWIDVDGYVEGEFFATVQFEGPDNIRLQAENDRIRVRID